MNTSQRGTASASATIFKPKLLGFNEDWASQQHPPVIMTPPGYPFTEDSVKELLCKINPYTAQGLDFVLQKEMKARIKAEKREQDEREKVEKHDAEISKIFSEIITQVHAAQTVFRHQPPRGFSSLGLSSASYPPRGETLAHQSQTNYGYNQSSSGGRGFDAYQQHQYHHQQQQQQANDDNDNY